MERRTKQLLRCCLAVAPIPVLLIARRLVEGVGETSGIPSLAGGVGRLLRPLFYDWGHALLTAAVVQSDLSLFASRCMRTIAELVPRVARTSATVLLRGETGVGKEVVARAIHAASPRVQRPLLKVNCAALPETLLETELFGHERGAFTGAYHDRPGRFELADGGTLLLDEIGEMSLEAQAKLLHVLDTGVVCRIGGTATIKTDVHVIAATNRHLERAVAARRFREDLYYRLKVIEIDVPPLRERREDIPALVDFFLERFADQYERRPRIGPDLLRRLVEHDWPGNVRELENAVRRIVILGEDGFDNRRCIPTSLVALASATARDTDGLKAILRRVAREAEWRAIHDVLEQVHWNRRKAARLLGISYSTLLSKITVYARDEVPVSAPRPIIARRA